MARIRTTGAMVRRVYDLTGVVQGVGFRPAFFRLAHEAGLGGWIQNRSGTVRVALDGHPADLDTFMTALPGRLPPSARLRGCVCVQEWSIVPPSSPAAFVIRDSDAADPAGLVIPADLRLCPDCWREIVDPSNRRHGYPFTTCTNCGPRYTVINGMPYDRERTTLARFPLCPDCRREYHDPLNRRFHAETIACPACGPALQLTDAAGRPIPGDPLRTARARLAAGAIVAVRGLGGYLLAADAGNRNTLAELRRRKTRPHKPFAVMAPDRETVRRFCIVPPGAAAALASSEGPVIILDARADVVRDGTLPLDLITPDTPTLGVMLPTTPLHALLAIPLAGDATPRFDLLIMTSGNRGGEPTCITNAEARERLGDIADFILSHNREINLRNDDSVGIVRSGAVQLWRRARGYAPNPIHLARRLARPVLAMGAEIRNAVAVGFDDTVVLSPHVGDLESPEAVEGLERTVRTLIEFLHRPPAVVAVDLHPDLQATRHGERLAAAGSVPLVRVQHHHAHALAALAEHGFEDGLALVFDGTGIGTDGAIWGAELLDVHPAGFRRLATFRGTRLPGADAAVRHPARQLVARWLDAQIDITPARRRQAGLGESDTDTWIRQSVRGIHAPLTHAAGRLFDAVSAWLGIAPETVTYEGQSAIRLEAAARRAMPGHRVPVLPYSLTENDGLLYVDWSPLFQRLADPATFADHPSLWALAFHHAVARAAADMVRYGLDHSRHRRIALSGGVFMNRLLNERLAPRLRTMGLTVLRHGITPPNDGGIALGQAVAAGLAPDRAKTNTMGDS